MKPLAALALASFFFGSVAGCAVRAQPDSRSNESNLGSGAIAVSASSVQALNGDLSSVNPTVQTADPGHSPSDYLSPTSALGAAGPLGAWGPLGALGPVGDNSWNASAWISAVGDWSTWSGQMTDLGGPLSDSGPLGSSGPLSDQAYGQTLPSMNDFCKQLQAGGVWTVLGPVGPLGPLGPLCPLGPVGAHGYSSDSNGNYLAQDGSVVRTVNVPYAGSTRTYELVEKYASSFAMSMPDNDTSFIALGSIGGSSQSDSYPITSHDAQFVTITVVPENALSDFDVEVDGSDGTRLAVSNSDGMEAIGVFGPAPVGNYIDFVQVQASAGQSFNVTVTAKTTNPAFPGYRLIVTGSTKYIDSTDISGAHQIAL